MGTSVGAAQHLVESRLRDAAIGSADACFDLGMAYSSGGGGVSINLVEAHKWFNLSAMNGSERAQQCRAEIAGEMTMREIAEAQRQARAWLRSSAHRAA